MKDEKTLILKTLVGSRAHGLNNKDSDYDYRGVYVEPTTEILKLGHKYKGSSWFEGAEDQTTYEVGHFLHLATKCNPSILEVFKAPIQVFDNDGKINLDIWGAELRTLFPYVWNPQDAFNAFVGYSLNQRKKMLDKKDNRQEKFAVAYLRTLWNLNDLLSTGDFSLEVKDEQFKNELIRVKAGKWNLGQVINRAEDLVRKSEKLKSVCTHKNNIDKVNSFLYKIRREFWE